MWLAKVRYYGEFFLHAILIVALAVVGLWRAYPEQGAVWLAAAISGAAIWTLVEYSLHRVVLHHLPYVRERHEAHHDDQTALIVIPVWLSLGLFAGLALLPLWLLAGRVVATGITGGLLLGYLWFDTVHHAIHHWRLDPSTYGYRLKRRHMLHHHVDDAGNFGVSTGFWDVVFGTDIKVGRAASSDRRG